MKLFLLKNIFTTLIIFLSFFYSSFAQEKLIYYPSGIDKVTEQKDLVYSEPEGKNLYFNFYSKTAGNSPKPLVIIMNGFGNDQMRNAFFQIEWAKLFAADEFAAITFDSRQQTVEDDFNSLIKYLDEHKSQLGISPDRIILYAASGNVYKSLNIAEDPNNKFIKGAIFYYGFGPVESFRYDLPVLFVRSGLDNISTNKKIDSLLSRAINENAPIEILNNPGGHHPFEFEGTNEYSINILKRTLQFAKDAIEEKLHNSTELIKDEIIAGTALYNNDFKTAVIVYKKLSEDFPENPDIRKALADALLGAEKYRDAVAQYQKAIDLGNWRIRDISIPAAVACVKMKDIEAVYYWMQKIVGTPNGKNMAKANPEFELLWKEERFNELLK
ncbi:MAG: hypothetical protein A2068_14170 [Ignavibacteria bacterium GWB2_35_6b]|nr:MAG: hypothetical protein A2068_14170 [Ignavibacteria bacterium GWB2_35_6b]